MSEIMKSNATGGNMENPAAQQLATVIGQMQQLMQGMADSIRATNARMAKLERQIELLTPLTGAQEKALCAEIRRRAAELCGQYHLGEGFEQAVAAAIRGELKREGGVRAVRELPRIEYNVLLERVALWDDYNTMRELRKRARDGGKHE